MLNMHSLVLSWINKNSISLLQYTGVFFLKKYITPDYFIVITMWRDVMRDPICHTKII